MAYSKCFSTKFVTDGRSIWLIGPRVFRAKIENRKALQRSGK